MEPVILQGEPPKAASLHGSGDGSGDGYGYGYGDGDGYGDGYGYGYGDGDGYGYGYGDGDKAYWTATIDYFSAKWPEAQQSRLAALRAAGATIAFWRSDEKGRAANGGKNTPVGPGTVETERGPLRESCGVGQLHATLLPPQWKGDRWWVVALLGEVHDGGDKLWSLQREIIGECV